jgi:signal transduction histidine kinase
LKSNFVSSVSHELRAPIASVRLMAESLERGTVREPARQQEYFRCIVQECRRLGTLIENVLDFSRIEQGRKSYEFAPADITALVTQTIHLLTPAAQDRHVSLQPSLAPLPPDAAAPVIDGLALQQALVNLIDNALKHSPPGSAVTVSLAPAALAANSPEGAATSPALELAVADQGPGIPPEERARIFERFYRRGSELRRETQGIGLGLSLVKHVADAHGGTVTVDSNAGQGSRFTLTFPIQPPRPTRGNASDAPSPA